jgi:serine/threonine protein kinase
MNENLIGNKYRILRQIGEGSFGKVFEGEHNRTKEKVAIKMEQITMDFKLLKNESKAYLLLAKETGFPRIKWYGVNDDDFYMVIDYLGPSLSSFKEEVDVLDMNLIIKLGIQMIDRVKSVHSAGLLHRDIKPDNFLFGNRVGFGSKEPILHLVDFGLCRSYKLPNGDHISLRTGKAMIGSPFFVSLNMHKGLEPSRRDDLESVV